MKILCVFGRYNYGNPARGDSYEYANFLPALERLGHQVAFFDSAGRDDRDFAGLNRRLLETVQAEQPDMLLCSLMHYEIWLETLSLIRACGNILLVNWGADDNWRYEQFSRFVSPAFHLYTTTYPDALAKSQRDGLDNFVLTQWAADAAKLAEPLPADQCRHAVTFVGSMYGNRRAQVEQLGQRGIQVECYGHGWDNGAVSADEMRRILRESVITLNFGDSGMQVSGAGAGRQRQIKARNFEVPGAGGFILTEALDTLDKFYVPDREVVMYSGIDELERKIRHYLAHPAERDAIARAAFLRTREEHTYDARFRELLVKAESLEAGGAAERPGLLPSGSGKAGMGVEGGQESGGSTPTPTLPLQGGGSVGTSVPLPEEEGNSPTHCEIDFARFDTIAKQYPPGVFLRLLKWLLVLPCMLVWGRRRGPRAARRIVFELSWRMAGAKTYTASGWPGRLFYRES